MLLPMKQPLSSWLVGFVACVKDYLEIQVGFGAVLSQDCIQVFVGLIFFFYICSWKILFLGLAQRKWRENSVYWYLSRSFEKMPKVFCFAGDHF